MQQSDSSETVNSEVNPVKQRTVFTANPAPKTKFNVAAPVFELPQYPREPDFYGPPHPIPEIQPVLRIGDNHVPIDTRIWRGQTVRSVQQPFIHSYNELNQPAPQAYSFPYSCMSPREPIEQTTTCGAVAHPNGFIEIRLREGVLVQLTLDGAIRVINKRSQIVIAQSKNGDSAALIHPNGRIHQYGSRVEIVAYNSKQNSDYNKKRYAKMWYKGISFTSDNMALTYLVDSAGTRTTTDSFTDLSSDYSLGVFYNASRYGEYYQGEAITVLQSSQYWSSEDGTDIFDVDGVRVSQTADGLVKVTRNINNTNKILIRTSPGNGSATLTNGTLHCTASLGQTSHLFVRRGERRLHFDGTIFVVRNAGHSAGFDEKNQLKVY